MLPTRRARRSVQAASLFNLTAPAFSPDRVRSLVKKHNAERAAKGFTCWTQFVAMLFCHLGRPIPCATSATAWPVVWAVWCISVSPKRRAGPPCPMPTSTARPPCSRNSSGPRWRASANSKDSVPANINSASRTSCCRWIRPPSRCAWRCFLGRSSAVPKAASRLTSCSITMTTCRLTCSLPRPGVATSSWRTLSP